MYRIATILFIIPLFCLYTGNALAQDQTAIDSLQSIISNSEEDTSRLIAFYEIGEQYQYILPDSALSYFGKALDLAEHTNSQLNRAICQRQLGISYEIKGLYARALDAYLKALAVYEEMDNKQGIASCYNDIAVLHYIQTSYELCIEYLTKSFEIKKDLGDTQGMANYYTNMASVKNAQGLSNEAIGYVLKSVDLFKELNDTLGIAVAYGNVGTVYNSLGNYEEALEYHLKSVELHLEINNKDGLAHSYSNISGSYANLADSVAVSQIQRDHYMKEAVRYGQKSLKIAKEIDAIYVENFVAQTLMRIYQSLGDYKMAFEYVDLLLSTKDSMFNQEKTAAIQEMQTKYETEQKQQQIVLQESQLLAKDARIKQEKIFRNALGTGLLAVLIIIVLIVYAYLQKKKDNNKIKEKNEQISEANEELVVLNEAISKQKNDILDSISYAEKIQSAMLPPEVYVTELLHENFILFKPRDIVSGDFYWIKQVNQYIVLVAADCTGHGVPGAFMSMLGMSYLTEIVQRREITRANQVLEELRKQIKLALRQHGDPDEAKDGIDMALCVMDPKNNRLQYAGANNPLYLIRDKNGETELQEYKADRMPLGYYQGKDSPFTNHDIALEPGDTLYMFSDGFVDQKGGDQNKRYMSKNLKSLLIKIQNQSMRNQKEILNKTLKDWMGNHAQTDDILIVGVRV